MVKRKILLALVSAAALLTVRYASGVEGRPGVDLLARYPTTLAGERDTDPTRARPWQFTKGDIYELSTFSFKVGESFRIESGPADLGIGHSVDGVVWAIVMPRGEARLGCALSDEPEAVAHVWLRFQPSVKLLKRHRVGSRITRSYDDARTPLDRLAEWYADQSLPRSVRALLKQRERTDPFELSKAIERELEQIDRVQTQARSLR